jgi:3-oxoacyl-[acyl-carrier protein] reductase
VTPTPDGRVAAPTSYSLAGHVLVVTGASSGIGRAIALAAARAGADVAATFAHDEAAALETAALIQSSGRRATVTRLDLADAAHLDQQLADVAHAAQQSLGRIDAWVNNAGADVLTGSGAQRSATAKLDFLLTVDLRGTIVASWHAAAVLGAQERGGCIINMSWDHVLSGMEGRNPQMFAAVKGGVLAFSKSLARSVAPAVRVNVLAPGWIETAFAAGLDRERRQAVVRATPLGRWGTPEDVAAAAVYLASPAAAFLTGQTIFVNGGVVMG